MSVPGLRLIGAASRMVPFFRREEWRREWEAEATYAWQRMTTDGHASLLSRARFLLRVSMCVVDASWEMKETMSISGLFQDLRFAVRTLLRYPAFTTIAVVTLALGIGANTAVFTLVDGVLLRPLPFPESDRLLSLQHLGRDGQDELPISEGLYLLYQDQAVSLEAVAMHSPTVVNLVTDGEPERVPAQAVTPGFFEVLGVEAAHGRTFVEEEGVPDAERVVILSDGLWKSTFGGDPDVVGRTVDMSGVSRRVVGIMPPDFGHPDRQARLWVPRTIDRARAPLAAFGAGGVARMAPGSSVESVYAELQGLITRLPELFPQDGEANFLAEVGLRARVQPLKQAVVGDVSATLWILLGTVGFVLLIACANVANLLLVRAEGRQRELALRVAVGAGRGQVLRTFMSESAVLAAAGGALGVLGASLAVRTSSQFIPSDLPRMAEVGMDGRVLAFTAAVSLGCAIFFGLFPLVRYGSDDLVSHLKDGGAHGATGGRDRHRLRNGLVVVQVAMALVLLVGSGLMFQSFLALRSVDPGFDGERMLTARISVPPGEIEGWEETAGFFRQLQQRMAQQAGVLGAGLTSRVPLTGHTSFGSMEVEDHPRTEDELPIFAAHARAEVGYFETMGIPLLEGRTFRAGDGAEGLRAVVVDASFAQEWWPGSSAVGRRVRGGPEGEDWWQIVGVVGDVHQSSLEEDPRNTVYWPLTLGLAEEPFPARTLDVVVKTASDPLAFLSVLRRELKAINPRIPLANPRTMDDVFQAATGRTSFTMAMLGAASGIALLLGLIGIYGAISYVVSQRTREIGVRMALGASGSLVRGMVVRQGLLLATGGVAVGLVAAALLSSVMGSLLYGVSATDPLTYGGVAVALVAVAALASWLPARRAAGVDPSRALRAD